VVGLSEVDNFLALIYDDQLFDMLDSGQVEGESIADDVPDLKNDPLVIAFELRLFRNLYATVVLSIAICAVATRSLWLTLAVALGAGLGIFNFRWLRSSLLVILGSGSSKPPEGTAFKLIWRYLVIAGIVFGAYTFAHLSLAAIVAGLTAAMIGPPIAEAGYQFYLVITRRGEF
jgi:hypothetical protein